MHRHLWPVIILVLIGRADVILTAGSALPTVKHVTSVIPIVFASD